MRGLVLTLIIWCFAAQSLALAVSPGCDFAVDHQSYHGETQSADGPMHEGMHGPVAEPMHGDPLSAMDHGDMPCCDPETSSNSAELCQLTCATSGCSSAAIPDQDLVVILPADSAPYRAISPSPIPVPQKNLLRPPIGA